MLRNFEWQDSNGKHEVARGAMVEIRDGPVSRKVNPEALIGVLSVITMQGTNMSRRFTFRPNEMFYAVRFTTKRKVVRHVTYTRWIPAFRASDVAVKEPPDPRA